MTKTDFSEVRAGQELPALTLAAVDRTTLALFCGASGDHNPIHIDLDFARNAGMPDVFAHGMLGMAWMGRCLTQWAPQSRLRSFNARFQGITHVGDIITVSGRIAGIVYHNGERCARIELGNLTQNSESRIAGEALVAID